MNMIVIYRWHKDMVC